MLDVYCFESRKYDGNRGQPYLGALGGDRLKEVFAVAWLYVCMRSYGHVLETMGLKYDPQITLFQKISWIFVYHRIYSDSYYFWFGMI